jgi:hypothetical protein
MLSNAFSPLLNQTLRLRGGFVGWEVDESELWSSRGTRLIPVR